MEAAAQLVEEASRVTSSRAGLEGPTSSTRPVPWASGAGWRRPEAFRGRAWRGRITWLMF